MILPCFLVACRPKLLTTFNSLIVFDDSHHETRSFTMFSKPHITKPLVSACFFREPPTQVAETISFEFSFALEALQRKDTGFISFERHWSKAYKGRITKSVPPEALTCP